MHRLTALDRLLLQRCCSVLEGVMCVYMMAHFLARMPFHRFDSLYCLPQINPTFLVLLFQFQNWETTIAPLTTMLCARTAGRRERLMRSSILHNDVTLNLFGVRRLIFLSLGISVLALSRIQTDACCCYRSCTLRRSLLSLSFSLSLSLKERYHFWWDSSHRFAYSLHLFGGKYGNELCSRYIFFGTQAHLCLDVHCLIGFPKSMLLLNIIIPTFHSSDSSGESRLVTKMTLMQCSLSILLLLLVGKHAPPKVPMCSCLWGYNPCSGAGPPTPNQWVRKKSSFVHLAFCPRNHKRAAWYTPLPHFI